MFISYEKELTSKKQKYARSIQETMFEEAVIGGAIAAGVYAASQVQAVRSLIMTIDMAIDDIKVKMEEAKEAKAKEKESSEENKEG